MSKFKLTTIFTLLCIVAPAMSASFEKIPSKSLRDDIRIRAGHSEIEDEQLLDVETDIKTRLWFFTEARGLANSGSPIDNRAYLFALAIDIYNSIPPDLQPDPQKLAPDEDVYEPNLWPIKKQLYFNKISTIDGNRSRRERTLEEKKRLLERFKRMNNPTDAELAAYFEKKYLRQHIREQVALGKIHLDAQDAPASISPSELDIYQPKYYAELREYMETVQSLIDTLTPPWEAEKQASVSKTKDKQTTTIIDQQLKPAIQPAERSTDVQPSEEIDLSRYILILALLAIGVVVLVYLLRRRGKK